MKASFHHYVWAFVLGAILLGLILPSPGLLIKPYLGYLLIALMTFSTFKIKLVDIKKAFLHKQVYLVVAITLLVTPLIAYFAKPLLDPLIFAGLILAAAIPAGVSIVFICDLCQGKPADALSITTLSHLLSILTIPLLLLLFVGQSVTVDIKVVIWSLIKFIVIPLIIAQLLRPILVKYPRFVFGFSTALLLIIIWGLVAPTQGFLISNLNSVILIFLIAVFCMLLTFLFGWFTGKNTQEKITYAVSASYKNFTLSTVIALSVFGELAALPSIVYTILNNLLFAILFFFVSRHQK